MGRLSYVYLIGVVAAAGCASGTLQATDDMQTGPPVDMAGWDFSLADLAPSSMGCMTGYHKCGATCIPAASCCTANDCPQPPNSTATCMQGRCSLGCNPGFKMCNGVCIGTSL